MASTTASTRRDRATSPQQAPITKASSAPPPKASSSPPFVRRSSSSYKPSSPIVENIPVRATSAAPTSPPTAPSLTSTAASRLSSTASKSPKPASPTAEVDARLGSPAPHAADVRARTQSRGSPLQSPVRETPPPVSDPKASSPSNHTKEKEDVIDMDVFQQILEMDDDEDDREFSKQIVFEFFDQAESTITDMQKAIEKKDLKTLESRGHFLKGSSGSLGIKKVQALCERLQHIEDETKDLTPEETIKRAVSLHSSLKVEYAAAEKWLKDFFE